MFHSRCDAIIAELRGQITSLKHELADARHLRDLDRTESREREDRVLERLAQVQRPAPAPIMFSGAPHAPAEDLKLEDLPPELFDPENALYIGQSVVPDNWVPPNFKSANGRVPRTAAGQALKAKLDAKQAAEEVQE